MIRKALLLAVALVCTPLPATVEAQVRLPVQPPYRQLGPGKSQEDSQPIPPAYRPPPGMCRIWLDNVPASQQPASTDCVSAVRNRPNNARVIFGDDYVDKRARGKDKDKDRDKDKKPESHVDAGDVRYAEPMEAVASPRSSLAFALGPRVHGPQAEDVPWYDDEASDSVGQPPARRRVDSPAARRAQGRDSVRRDATAGRARAERERTEHLQQAEREWREPPLRGRSGTELSEERRALRERLRDPRDPRVGRNDRDDRDDDYDDDRYDRGGRDRRDPRDAYGRDGYNRDGYNRDGYGRSGAPYPGVYGNSYGYGNAYGNSYGYYPPPGRANGVCLDRDGDGWCDDSRTGGGFCVDRDGDGRCDDYPDLASAPYSSAMPPMAAALDVQRGRGSQAALRWLGTAEVTVRTSELTRTGSPYRVMWLDASTQRILQVWTDRDGDGIADRVEIYRNGRVTKILGR